LAHKISQDNGINPGASVDKRYEQYCLASPFFYDLPPGQDFAIACRQLPEGWRQERQGDWAVCVPPDPRTPRQGWKIHASACLDNSEDIITRVWEYCVPRDISFKFVSSRLGVLVRNGKYAPRGASGKIVTIYPRDEVACERILADLDADLGGAPGPYILSDLRYGAGPLYARYGGFTERLCCDDNGDLVPAIETDTGELVPDVRSPVFTTPPWVPIPSFLAPHLAVRNAATVDGLPYRVEDVLHFSNGGGVYLGVDEHTGERVVLKEARPHAGLAADGSDAVARLRREHDMLNRLSGLGIAPEPRGYYEAGGHHFLAEEFIEGVPLNSCYSGRYPLTTADPDPGQVAAYTQWALRICADITRAAAAMHGRGVVFNDLHMFNIMVRPDDTVIFIDFEAASLVSEGRRVTLGNPGFVAPRDRTGFGVDAYSLGCIRLAMFLPLTTLLTLDRAKAGDLADVIGGHFPVPAEFLAEAVREIIGGDRSVKPADRSTTADYEQRICQAMTASATPARDDRLFPGDIEQFAAPGGGLGIAHGAAGVLYALAESAGVRVGEHEQWLVTRAVRPAKGSRLGLYDGLAGVAWVLSRLGYLAAAVETAGFCADSPWERLGSDLYGGLAGFALALLAVGDAAGESGLTDAGLRAAELAADRQAAKAGLPRGAAGPAAKAGLLRGAAGQALLFLRLYERTGETAYLDLAEDAIGADLAGCVTDHRGSLQVDEGWRMLPYLNAGSAGIGMVIDRYLRHRPDDGFAKASSAIRIAARSTFYAQSGLFNGRAGMVIYLAAAGDTTGAQAQALRLPWHAVPYADGMAFAGDQLLRLSMDLGTGSAGILLALAAARGVPGAVLPFFDFPGKPAQGSVTRRATVRG
jgi:class III lanthionine synthetase